MLENIYISDKCIQIKPTNRSIEETTQIASRVGITNYEAQHELLWHEISGKDYRFKFTNHLVKILNELIGPKLALKFDLRTANNVPAVLNYSEKIKFYGILSENFKDIDKQYLNMYELGFTCKQPINNKTKNIRKLKKYCDKEDYEPLINSIFKMTCLDHIMNQSDRVASNFLFEKDNSKLSFAPLFDYSEAYESVKEGCTYDRSRNPLLPFTVGNAFMTLAFWETNYKWFLRKYPQFIKYLEIASEIDIIEVLEEIEKEFSLNIPDEYKEYYDIRTKEKQKVLIY